MCWHESKCIRAIDFCVGCSFILDIIQFENEIVEAKDHSFHEKIKTDIPGMLKEL